MKHIASLLFSALVMSVAAQSYAATATTPVNQHALAPTQTTQVNQIDKLADDSKVMLKGKIIKSLGDEKYEFRDATGTVKVEIDDELWGGKALSPTQQVTLIGEIDIDHKPTKRVEVEVKEIRF